MRGFGIGELSSRSKVPVASIRYYEEIGILPKAARRNGRHRNYDDSDLSRLSFVRGSRELGFTLEQVRTLLYLSEPGNLTCTEARDLSASQLATVRKRIEELRVMEAELSKHIAACDSMCACGRAPRCPVLNVFDASLAASSIPHASQTAMTSDQQ